MLSPCHPAVQGCLTNFNLLGIAELVERLFFSWALLRFGLFARLLQHSPTPFPHRCSLMSRADSQADEARATGSGTSCSRTRAARVTEEELEMLAVVVVVLNEHNSPEDPEQIVVLRGRVLKELASSSNGIDGADGDASVF